MANSTTKYKVVKPKVQQYQVADTPDITPYQGVQYDNSYRDNVDTSYYNNAINKYKDYAEQNRANQLSEAAKTQQSALKQAYITRAQNERKLSDNLTRSGIRGGATESSMLNLANQYGQARSAANTDYSNSVNAINQSIDQNIMDYTNDMESRAEEYRQNMANAMWQAAREDYSNQWQAENDRAWNVWNAQNEANAANVAAKNEAAIALANAKTERNANTTNFKREDLTNVTSEWANRYSKSSKSTLRSMMNKLDKRINKAHGAKKARLVAKRQGLAQALANK